MPRFVLPALFLLVSLMTGARASAQATQPASQPDPVRVYLVTIGPGKEVWEKFGHNMIWIHDPQGRPGAVDAAYNWGMFNFDHFISNFLAKRMRYWMQAFQAEALIQDYIDSDRSVWIQELNLTMTQKEQLLFNVEANRLPENKYYDYDYYTNNCSTQVRDALDRVLDGAMKAQFASVMTETTYRFHTRRLVADDWPTDLALTYVEGPSVDRKITQWEESFLPVRFMQHVRNVKTANGPLVLSERTLHISKIYTEREAPPNRFIPYLLFALVCGAAMLPFGLSTSRGARIAAAIVIFLWCVLGTIATIMLAYLWFATSHGPPKSNENMLALGPATLVLLVLFPIFRKVSRVATIVAGIGAGLSVLGLLIQALPGLDQVNGDIIAFTLVPNVALAATLYFAHQKQTDAITQPESS